MLSRFDGHDDPRHAMNWPLKRKVLISIVLIFDSLAATFASSVFSPAAPYLEQEFGLGAEVITLVRLWRSLIESPLQLALRITSMATRNQYG